MPENKNEIELNPVDSITVDAIGKPGERVFYLQGRQAHRVLTLIVEKIQVQTLALGIAQFLSEVIERYPEKSPVTVDFDEALMQIQPPVDPLFRVGEIRLGFDSTDDLVIVMAYEILTGTQPPEEVRVVNFWCTRAQAHALGIWAMDVVKRGRSICPYCGQPMDPEGHFCPKKNGHKH